METLDITTETRTLETLEQAAETLKEADSDMIRDWLLSLVPGLLGFALQVVLAMALYFVGSRAIHLSRRLLRRWLEKADVDLGAKQFLDALLKYFLYFVLVVLILTLFGVTAASVVAVIGSAGLALGLAIQGSLANFAGGVLILLLKPFQVVDEISIFYTRLLSVDRKTIVVPNGVLANSSLTNTTFSDIRRVDLEIGIAYEADLLLAKEILLAQANAEEARLADQETVAFVSELGASEVKLGLRLWVKTEDYWTAKWRLTERIKLAFDEAKIEIPYQKIDVMMRE